MNMLKDGILYLPDETFAVPTGDNGVLVYKTHTGQPYHPRKTLELKLTDKDVSNLFRLLAIGSMDVEIRAPEGVAVDVTIRQPTININSIDAVELEPLPAGVAGIVVGMDLRDGVVLNSISHPQGAAVAEDADANQDSIEVIEIEFDDDTVLPNDTEPTVEAEVVQAEPIPAHQQKTKAKKKK